MSTAQYIGIPRLSDKQWLRATEKIQTTTGHSPSRISTLIFPNLTLDAAKEKHKQDGHNLISTVLWNFPNAAVGIQRGESPTHFGLYDRLTVDYNNNTTEETREIVSTFLFSIAKEFKAFKSGLERKGLEHDDVFASSVDLVHHEMLKRLEDANVSLVERYTQFNEKFLADKAQFEEHCEAKYNSLEQSLKAKYETDHAELEERSKKLDLREKEFDTRDNTFARRDWQKQLIEEISERQKNFSLTPDTQKKRFPIHVACLTGAVLLLFYISISSTFIFESIKGLIQAQQDGIQISSSSYSLLFVTGIKSIGATVALITLCIFYLRWMNSWFNAHANTEFKIKQFQLDIGRAYWLVETALEWNKIQNTPMPEQLVGSLSKNLFGDEDKCEDVKLPQEEIAKLLIDKTTQLKLNLPGGEVSVSGKAIKDLATKAE